MDLLHSLRESTRNLGEQMQSLLCVKPGEPQAMDLSAMRLEDKLALGQKQCDRLTAVAYRYAPEPTLDMLEAELDSDVQSKDLAQSALAKAIRTEPPESSNA